VRALTGGQSDFESQHEIARPAVALRARTHGGGREHAAHGGGDTGRVQRKLPAVGADDRLGGSEAGARPRVTDAFPRIEFVHSRQPLRREQYPLPARCVPDAQAVAPTPDQGGDPGGAERGERACDGVAVGGTERDGESGAVDLEGRVLLHGVLSDGGRNPLQTFARQHQSSGTRS
jgi:hypothetical protein